MVSKKEKAKRVAIKEMAVAENEGHLYPKRECEYFGEEFWPAGPNTKPCSEKCSHQHGIDKMREWRTAQKAEVQREEVAV